MGANESINKVSGDVKSTIDLGLSSLSGGYIQTAKGFENVTTQGIKSGENVLTSGIGAYVDTERSVVKGINNVTGELGHTGRFVAKNAIALVDNTQDNLVQVVQDIRVDVTNTVQMTFIVMAGGAAIFFILFGDKIMERGINLSGLEIL